jgi:hypothetical protein
LKEKTTGLYYIGQSKATVGAGRRMVRIDINDDHLRSGALIRPEGSRKSQVFSMATAAIVASVRRRESERRQSEWSDPRKRMAKLKAAMAANNLTYCLDIRFRNQPLILPDDADDDRTNAFQLWSKIAFQGISERRADLKTLFEVLLKTVGPAWIDRRCLTGDGQIARPIDVAGPVQMSILLENGADCRPTNMNFPICRAIRLHEPKIVCDMIDRLDPAFLDFGEPTTGLTPLFLACLCLPSFLWHTDGVFRKLSEKIPHVNPFHACFNGKLHLLPQSFGMKNLTAIRLRFSDYKKKLAAPAILAAADGCLPIPDLLAIVVDYVL